MRKYKHMRAGAWEGDRIVAFVCPSPEHAAALESRAAVGSPSRAVLAINPRWAPSATPFAAALDPVFSLTRHYVVGQRVSLLRVYPSGWHIYQQPLGEEPQLIAIERSRPGRARLSELVLRAVVPLSSRSADTQPFPAADPFGSSSGGADAQDLISSLAALFDDAAPLPRQYGRQQSQPQVQQPLPQHGRQFTSSRAPYPLQPQQQGSPGGSAPWGPQRSAVHSPDHSGYGVQCALAPSLTPTTSSFTPRSGAISAPRASLTPVPLSARRADLSGDLKELLRSFDAPSWDRLLDGGPTPHGRVYSGAGGASSGHGAPLPGDSDGEAVSALRSSLLCSDEGARRRRLVEERGSLLADLARIAGEAIM
jgi:Domain of unknown function (DUF1995)